MSASDARAAVDRAIRRIRQAGIHGPRPLEQIEQLDGMAEAGRKAMRQALADARGDDIAAAVHLVRLMRASDLSDELADAALRRPAPLSAKIEAVAALRDWGIEVPPSVEETLELARSVTESPNAESVARVLTLSEAWRGPVLDAMLEGAIVNQPHLLELVLGTDATLDERIVERLGRSATQDAVEPLRQLESGPDKRLRKLAKRALHQLRSQGVDVEAGAPDTGAGAFSLEITPDTRREARAFLTGVDGAGARIVWVLAPSTTGGQRLLEAVIDDVDGVRRADVMSVTLSGFRQHVDRLRSNPGILITQSGSDEVAGLLVAAERLNVAADGDLPEEYRRFRSELAPALFDGVEVADRPSPFDLVPRDEIAGNRQLLEDSAELLGLPYFSSWALTGPRAERAAHEVREAETSQLALDEEQRKQQVDRAIRGVAASFDADLRHRYRSRLDEMTRVLWACKRPEQVRWALAAGLGFTEVSDLYSDHPFARGLIQRGVMVAYQELGKREEGDDSASRIVRP